MFTTIRYSLIALALVPLVMDRSVFFPYITGKSMVIRLIITLAWVLLALGLVLSIDLRDRIAGRLKKVLRSPIFWMMISFAVIISISAIFAVPNFHAISGDVERAEGMVGMLYYISIGVLMLLTFKESDWKWFFKVSLVTAGVLFLHAVYQASGGLRRPSSFLGNPIYLADVFLFSTFASWWLLAKKNMHIAWKIFSIIMIPVSVFGVFLTETRGVIAGMIAGLIAIAIYLIFSGDIKIFGRWGAKKVALVILLVIVVFSGGFIATKNANFWKGIPGLDRLSQFTLHDATLQTRLISLGIGWEAIHPSNEGVKKFLIGWGPENFNVAYNKYYNPEFYRYESAWFDRAHDKLMDMMVMHGAIGLLIYLGLWSAVGYEILKKKKNISETLALIFFAVGYFVQNLFVFDSVATYILFFSFIGFVGWRSFSNDEDRSVTNNNAGDIHLAWVTGVGFMALLSLIGFIWFSMVPYVQMREYISLKQSGSLQKFSNGIDKVTSPYTVAQENIRENILSTIQNQISKDPSSELVSSLANKGIALMNGLLEHESYEPRFYIEMAQFYGGIGDGMSRSGTSGTKFYDKSLSLLGKARELAPKRSEILYMIAYNYAKNGDIDKSTKMFSDISKLDPEMGDTYYYWGMVTLSEGESKYNSAYDLLEKAFNSPYLHKKSDDSLVASAYARMLPYFKNTQDKERFIGCAQRLLKISSGEKDKLDDAIKYAEEGNWGAISIE